MERQKAIEKIIKKLDKIETNNNDFYVDFINEKNELINWTNLFFFQDKTKEEKLEKINWIIDDSINRINVINENTKEQLFSFFVKRIDNDKTKIVDYIEIN